MKKIKITLFLTLLALIAVFIIIFNNLNVIFSEVQRVESRVATLQSRADNIIKFEKEQDILDERIKKIESMFINLKVPIDFIAFLEEKGENLLFEISPRLVMKEEGDSWDSLRIQISLKGDYFTFMRFLEEIENSPFLVEVLNITINREEELLEEIQVSLLIKIFGKI